MKREVHKLLADWDRCLHIRDGTHWRIEGITGPDDFFRHLAILIPEGTTMLFEGLEIGATARSWYAGHPARYVGNVACDTLAPVPESHHIAFSNEFASGLLEIIKSQGLHRAFYHFKAYSDQEILFYVHDAFEGEFVISNSIEKITVDKFASALGLVAAAADFPHNQRDYLKTLDRALNPPWWKQMFRAFRR